MFFLIVSKVYLQIYKLYVSNHLVFLEILVYFLFDQALYLEPPFQCFVVKPNTSTFTEHRSKVFERISAHIDATEIGLPLIDPELSIKIVTKVSLNSVSFFF